MKTIKINCGTSSWREYQKKTHKYTGVSKHNGKETQIMNFNRVFHYFEPSILGVFPLFLETPIYYIYIYILHPWICMFDAWKKSKHILPNGGLAVIYNSKTNKSPKEQIQVSIRVMDSTVKNISVQLINSSILWVENNWKLRSSSFITKNKHHTRPFFLRAQPSQGNPDNHGYPDA